jgi:predicted DNA-binding mobile mystery protein A
MSVKSTVRRQYQAKIDSAANAAARELEVPPEGWISTVRNALGITGAQLGRLTGRTRATISAAEKSERDGRVTLQNLEALADALNCKLVYALLPREGSVSDLLETQARKKAEALVSKASAHMALEKQALKAEERARQVELLASELLRDRPSEIWER